MGHRVSGPWVFVPVGFCPPGLLSHLDVVPLGFCPHGILSSWVFVFLGFCPLGYCPMGFCPVRCCPRTGSSYRTAVQSILAEPGAAGVCNVGDRSPTDLTVV